MVGFNISLIPSENQTKYTIPKLIRMYIRSKLTFNFLQYSYNVMINKVKSLFKKKFKSKSSLPFIEVKPFYVYDNMKYDQLKMYINELENIPMIEKETKKLYKLKNDIENFDDKTNSLLELNELKEEFEQLFKKTYSKGFGIKIRKPLILKDISRNLQSPLLND